MKKKLVVFVLFICTSGCFALQAQEFSPFTNSPFAGVTAGKLNPASLAGSNYKLDITLFGASANVHNDLLSFSRKKILYNPDFYSELCGNYLSLLNFQGNKDSKNFLKKYFTEGSYFGNNNANWDENASYSGYAGAQIDLLNLMYSVNSRLTLAAGYGIRWQAGVQGIPASLIAKSFEVMGKPVPSTPAGVTVANELTTGYIATYDQVFLSAAYTVLKTGRHRLKLGATGKLLFKGISPHTTIFLVANQGYSIAPSQPDYGVQGLSGEVGRATGSNFGFSGDFGVEYEYHPETLADDDIAAYRFKAGIAALDLGAFAVRNNNNDYIYKNLRSGNGFPKGLNSLIGYYTGQPGNKADRYVISLPAALTFALDYRLLDNLSFLGHSALFLNAMGSIDLNHYARRSIYKYSYATLTPRIDWRKFGVSLPLQIDQFNNFTAGFSVRLWNVLWIGSNTLLYSNLIPKVTNNAADIHVMLKIPILKSPQSGDSDNDGVPDKFDRCPHDKGLKKFEGCPDSDGDGIPDYMDACPNDAGTAVNGCPDRDGDDIPDANDRCPDVAGESYLNGCPDRDGDGIADIDDECPDIPGTKAAKGCPDSDGDGIPDKDDNCPDKRGTADLNGCPDRDGDGIADNDDECPDRAGVREQKGCPSLSGDYKRNVEFDVDKYDIKAEYYAELGKIAETLEKNPNATVLVTGHTDNTYTYSYNMQLSKRRAESVKSYLMRLNVDAKRIATDYKGYTVPAGYTTRVDDATIKAANATVEQRAHNRRSEVSVTIR
jgi:outer membrane protein OmpA-like peptidoglycan-associated protein